MARRFDSKLCASCGRTFEWRKKWERSWPSVRFCSDACRRNGVRPLDRRLERSILDLLAERSPGASICPSEAARRVGGDDWRPLMERTRRAARRLAAGDRVEITQRGRVVDLSAFRGPVWIRRVG